MSIYSIRVIWMSCLLAMTSYGVNAQIILREEAAVEYSIEEIGVPQGLSQGMVHGMDVDLKGYLWIATKDGLNRYDGNHFHVFRHDPRDSNSIASNYIRSVHVDDNGLIWVGTNASGLELYNPAKEGFVHFGTALNSTSKPSLQSVTKIFSDPSGKIMIWEGTGNVCQVLTVNPGLNLFDARSWTIKSITEAYHIPAGLPMPTSYSMIGFSAEGVLLSQDLRNLYGYFPVEVTKESPYKTFGIEGYERFSSGNSVHYFLDDSRRIFFFSEKEKMLYQWHEDAHAFQSWIKFPSDYPWSANRFFFDHQGRLWNNPGTSELKRIDFKAGIFQVVDVTRYHYAGTEETDYYIICEDDQHNLWAGTPGNGIVKITSRNDQFTRISRKVLDDFGVLVVRNGLSFNIHDDYSLSKQVEFQKQLDAKKLMLISTYAEDSLKQLWCIAIDDHQRQHFIMRLNPEDLSVSYSPITICRQAPYENLTAMVFDRHGVFWIATECINGKAHLVRFDHQMNPRDTFILPVQVVHTEHAFITDWYVDAQNLFWIGTKQGLFVFDPATTKWKHFIVDPQLAHALSNSHILSLCPDPKEPARYLWIGTDGGGLNKLDIKAETFRQYTTENGLPNNVIYGVQSDKHDNLWMSTNMGLCRLDPRSEEVWSFTIADGLPGNEFNRMEYGKDGSGRLYFGGIEGMTIFDPEVFYIPAGSSPIVINRLKLSNKEVFYSSSGFREGKNDYILPAPLEQCTRLKFPYTERMITLGFSLLDFTNPTGNKYRYKLEGFNDEWIDAGDLNEAVFTNLNPGTYTFLVSGRNSDNQWSDPALMQLVILSPWWGTWWFRTLFLIMIAGGIYAFYRSRLQQAMKLQHLRNRIAADLHDEIGSTLSSISLAGTVIQHKLKDRHPEVDGLVQKINHHTQTMMEAMSDIVWAVNTKNDRFDQVLHRMRAFAAEILEPKDVMVHFDVSPNISQLQLDMQQRKNLYLIFKEVINNAAKYAQCSNVWIAIVYIHGRIVMEVRDDGVGFDMQPIHKRMLSGEDERSIIGMGGNGIQNMNHRALELKGKLEIHSSPGQGTKVILTFNV